jgi:hypothetical protein
MEIEVWYGCGDRMPVGPLAAELVRLDGDVARFRIVDEEWLEDCGFDAPPEFEYGRMRPDRWVGNDAYAWCPAGEGGAPNR